MLENIEKPRLSWLLNHKNKHHIDEMYQCSDYIKMLQILSDLVNSNYSKDPDLLHNLGCAFFMIKEYQKALECFIKSVNIIWSYHVTYHFISSSLYYNRGLITKNKDDFIRAEFLYHENNQAKEQIINFTQSTLQDPYKYILKKENIAGDLFIFNQNTTFDIDIIDQEHFRYHCEAANQFFNRGICFALLEKKDIALFDFIRAVEFDNKNPANTKINSFIFYIQNDSKNNSL